MLHERCDKTGKHAKCGGRCVGQVFTDIAQTDEDLYSIRLQSLADYISAQIAARAKLEPFVIRQWHEAGRTDFSELLQGTNLDELAILQVQIQEHQRVSLILQVGQNDYELWARHWLTACACFHRAIKATAPDPIVTPGTAETSRLYSMVPEIQTALENVRTTSVMQLKAVIRTNFVIIGDSVAETLFNLLDPQKATLITGNDNGEISNALEEKWLDEIRKNARRQKANLRLAGEVHTAVMLMGNQSITHEHDPIMLKNCAFAMARKIYELKREGLQTFVIPPLFNQEKYASYARHEEELKAQFCNNSRVGRYLMQNINRSFEEFCRPLVNGGRLDENGWRAAGQWLLEVHGLDLPFRAEQAAMEIEFRAPQHPDDRDRRRRSHSKSSHRSSRDHRNRSRSRSRSRSRLSRDRAAPNSDDR